MPRFVLGIDVAFIFNISVLKMLASGRKHAQTPGAILLATDRTTGRPYYYVPSQEYPDIQTTSDDLLSLLSPDWLLTNVFRKYSLSKDEIATLVDFFKRSNDQTSLEIGDSWKLKRAFQTVEDRLLMKMKTCVIDSSLDLEPHHPSSFRTIVCIAPSGSGKTWVATSILLRPEFLKRKCYIFTTNERDSTLQRLKQRSKRYNVWIDLDKIRRPLRLSDFEEDCVLLVDDVWDGLGRGDKSAGFDLRKSLVNLCDEVMVRGRHHTRGGGPGTSLILTTHVLASKGMDKQTLYTEAQNIYLFPSASSHTISSFMTNKLGIHRTDVRELMKSAHGSRFIMIYNNKPQVAIFKHGICLL